MSFLILLHFCVGLVIALHFPLDEKLFINEEETYRLPKTLKPTRYDLEITPNFDDDNFVGTVRIYMNTLEDTTNVTVHIRNLDVKKDDISIIYDNGGRYESKSFSMVEEPKREFLVLIFLPGLRKGSKYIVTISNFIGKLNTKKRGFYLGYLKNKNGELRKFAATQFKPTNGREAFPCFDEPEYKAVLNLKINKVDETYMTVANSLRNSSTSSGLSDVFNTTITMSTYLYAFVISEMRLSDVYAKVRVLTRPQDLLADKHIYALAQSQNLLNKMEEYLNLTCDLEKIDHVAIPDEYSLVGATENWGLITYKASQLLSSEETNTKEKQLIVTTIAREISQQWFGNLVTPTWWDYVWLNEGLATFFSYYAAYWVEPNMDLMKQFVVNIMHNGLYLDSLDTTRAMNANVNATDEISSLFDGICYEKAASIIRMLEGFVSKYVFKKALNVYLNTKKFQTSTPIDFYRSVQSVLDNVEIELLNSLNISDIMSSWDSTIGYPVVNVIRKYGVKENNIKLSQERFVLNDSIRENGTWKIPINFYSIHYTNSTLPTTWLTQTEDIATYPYMNDNNWLIANVKQTGFYRVNYDDTNWGLIKDALINQHKSIDVLNRAQIIDDAFNLARSGRLDYIVPIQLSTYLKQERDYIPFHPFFKSITFLNSMLQYTNIYKLLKSYTLDTLKDVYLYLRFEDSVVENHTDTLNRMNVLNWFCRYGHEDCQSLALKMFRIWKNEGKSIPVNLQSVVFCGAMRTATKEDHEFLLSKLTDDYHLRSRIINGLGCSENTEILIKYLELSLSESNNLSPDAGLKSVYDKSAVGLEVALDFLEDNFAAIKNTSIQSIKYVIDEISEIVATERQLKQLKRIADNNGDTHLFEFALVNAQNNIKWINKKSDAISAALNIVTTTGGSVKVYGNRLLVVFISILMIIKF